MFPDQKPFAQEEVNHRDCLLHFESCNWSMQGADQTSLLVFDNATSVTTLFYSSTIEKN